MTSPEQDSISVAELCQFCDEISLAVPRPEFQGTSGESVRLQCDATELEGFFGTAGRLAKTSAMTQRRLDKKLATRFNVFDLIEPDENKLSDILRDLLDPEGIHGQGDLFLRLLFRQLGLESSHRLTKGANVYREALTHGTRNVRRRMDLFINAGVLVVIENKVGSREQPDQVKDYIAHLRYCQKESKKQGVLIYLSPSGKPPQSLTKHEVQLYTDEGLLHCWSYHKNLRPWMESCRRACQAPKIAALLEDFCGHIESRLRQAQQDYEGGQGYEA